MIKKLKWDFIDVNTKYASHGFHTYPAMMIPQVAEQLIKTYGNKSKLLFDPYCGSGTSLVEANLAGINAAGTDINPLARLIAKTKTRLIEQQELELYFKDFYDFLFQFRYGIVKKDSVVLPTFSNIDYWFSKSVINDISIIKNYIDSINNVDVKNFFTVAFSQTIRETSWTRKNEYKLYRMDKEKIKKFKPDVFTIFELILAKNKKGLKDFSERKKNSTTTGIFDFNTVNISPSELINEEIDFVLTSPPYGDSITTVAYGQFSRLTNQWLGNPEANKLDKKLMGGVKNTNIEKFNSPAANRIIRKLQKINLDRAYDVYSFYADYYNSIKNISKSLTKSAYVCYVVSNRNVCGLNLPTNEITYDFFEENGLTHKNTFTRKISNKRLPRLNSPSGISGQKKSLMNEEYLIIMKKS